MASLLQVIWRNKYSETVRGLRTKSWGQDRGQKRKTAPGWGRKLYNGELHNFYSSPNITGVSKLWFAGHVARIDDMQNDHIIAAHNSEKVEGGG